jgi:hypothetical protein
MYIPSRQIVVHAAGFKSTYVTCKLNVLTKGPEICYKKAAIPLQA